MGNISFDVSRARLGYYASLPGSNDGFVMVPLESAGLEDDATLAVYATLGDLLAAANNEQTTMGRKAMTGVTLDESASPTVVTADDVTWPDATGNDTGAVVVCYDPDTTTGTDSTLIPLAKWDFSTSPTGGTVSAQSPTIHVG